MLAGGGTDPASGPLLALAYWPLNPETREAHAEGA
jgi:hypothetical protein